MGIFKKRIKCDKFFTYRTNTINVSGLSTGLTKDQLGDFDLKLGQFEIKPEYEKASEKLKELDLLQFTICQSIRNINNNSKRDDLLIQLVEIKMEMLKIAQRPQDFLKLSEDSSKGKNIENDVKEPEKNDKSQIKELLSNNNSVGEAIKRLRIKMPDENTIIMHLAEYNQLISDIQKGIRTFSSPEWNNLINRIILFVDSQGEKMQ